MDAPAQPMAIVMLAFLAVAASLALAAAHPPAPPAGHAGSHHWSYSGDEGPSHWARLDSQYRLCGSGKKQSPINIRSNAVYRGEAPPLEFDYRPARATIEDNGHSVQIDYEPGSTLHVGHESYELVQFHFHHPSEERVDGKRFDMVAHLVHRSPGGELAVVAVLMKVGRENPLLNSVWRHLPPPGKHGATEGASVIDVRDLIPANHAYFSYVGSLTTPPCTEGVRWFVVKTPIEISKDQLDVFAARYPNDARPVQKLNGRHVIASR
jgi:carbonic anhydrase